MMPLLALPEGGEWIVILIIVVLLFGAKKLPELTRNAAKAMKEFEKARQGDDDEQPAQLTAPQQPQTMQPQAVQQQPQTMQAQPQPMQAQPSMQAQPVQQPQAAVQQPVQQQPVQQQPVQQQPVQQSQVQPQPVQPPVDGSAGRTDLEGGGSQGVGQ